MSRFLPSLLRGSKDNDTSPAADPAADRRKPLYKAAASALKRWKGSGSPETWDGGETFHDSMTKQPPAKLSISHEKAAMEAVAALDAVERPTPHARADAQLHSGVSVAFLREFAKEVIEVDYNMTTWEVVERYIKPRTRKTRCRYCELPEVIEHTGRADYFLSHTWGAPFSLLVAAASQVPGNVWIDIFAVRQWPGNDADLDFKPVVQGTKALMLVASDVEELAPNCPFYYHEGELARYNQKGELVPFEMPERAYKECAFYRVWCLAELLSAWEAGTNIMMFIGSSTRGGRHNMNPFEFVHDSKMSRFLQQSVDVRKAVCAVPRDRDRILQEVRQISGFDELNAVAGGLCRSADFWRARFTSELDMDSYKAVLRAATGHYSRLKKAVEHKTGHLRNNLLKYAAAGGFPDVVRYLLSQGVGPEIKETIDEECILHYAVQSGSYETCKVLIDAGVEVNYVDGARTGLLVRAAENGHKRICRLLLKAGTDGVQEAFLYARGMGHKHLERMLIRHGAKDDGSEGLSNMFL